MVEFGCARTPIGAITWTRDWGPVTVMPFTCIDCGSEVRALDAGWHILYGHRVAGGMVCDNCQHRRLYGTDQT